MTLPTTQELLDKLRRQVDAKSDQDEFLTDCVNDAVAYITLVLPNTGGGAELVDGYLVPVEETSPIGDQLYAREVVDLATDLFWRRQAKNGIVSTDALGNPVRISADPWKAASARLSTLQPWGFA